MGRSPGALRKPLPYSLRLFLIFSRNFSSFFCVFSRFACFFSSSGFFLLALTAFENIGADIKVNTPQQFAEFIRAENARWGSLIQKLGIKLD